MSMLARFLVRSDDGGMVVEPMRRRHVSRVLEIERVSYPKPWTMTVFHDELDQVGTGHRHYLVARSGRSLLGYGGLMFVADEAHVTNIAVHPDQRRSGVATRLLGDLADVAIGRGCQAWTLEVRASSHGAQELYRAFGFVPAGVRARYYEHNEDAIVMWCHDIQAPEYAARLAGLRRSS
jgi:ribosomal-protein-alanine N-acetyltransferase